MIKAIKKFILDFETAGLIAKKQSSVSIKVVEEKKISVAKVRVGMVIKQRYNYGGMKSMEVVEIQPPPKRSKSKNGHQPLYLLRVKGVDGILNLRLSKDELVTLA